MAQHHNGSTLWWVNIVTGQCGDGSTLWWHWSFSSAVIQMITWNIVAGKLSIEVIFKHWNYWRHYWLRSQINNLGIWNIWRNWHIIGNLKKSGDMKHHRNGGELWRKAWFLIAEPGSNQDKAGHRTLKAPWAWGGIMARSWIFETGGSESDVL